MPLGPDDAAPTAYVHFQFLGNPDKVRRFAVPGNASCVWGAPHIQAHQPLSSNPDQFTNPVQGSRDPQFNERFVFPMLTNDQQLRLLSRSKLQLTVVDLHGEEDGEAGEDAGLIGDVFVSLNDVADGQSLNDKVRLWPAWKCCL